jgi:hypothetical protein
MEVQSLRADERDLPSDVFKDSSYGGWTGFYDWLRSDTHSVVGVRYWPFEEASALINRLALQTAKMDSSGALYFFFTSQHQFDEQISGDQAFEESRILIGSKKDEIAFVFGCSDLTGEEWESIIRAVDELQ